MLLLDSVTNVTLSVDDVCGLDSSRVSNVDAFRKFAGGICLEPDFLLNDRWSRLPPMPSLSSMYGMVMFEMLPFIYNARWLEAIGGSFGVRITGIGDYTLVAVNRRVVTFAGLAVDAKTQGEALDLEIAPEVMLAFCRGLMLDIADDILSENEFEDREISGAELLLHGMPSGGYVSEVNVDFANTLSGARQGNVGMLGVNSVAYGVVGTAYDQDYFALALNAGNTYRIDLRGYDSARGTLANPYISAVYDAAGYKVASGNDDANGSRDSQITFKATKSGIYYVLAGAYRDLTGSYQISVTDTFFDIPLLPATEIAGDFASDITRARNGQIGAVSINGLASGKIASSGDRDWNAVSMQAGISYRIDLRGAGTGRGTLTDPYLWAIYSSDPNPIASQI